MMNPVHNGNGNGNGSCVMIESWWTFLRYNSIQFNVEPHLLSEARLPVAVQVGRSKIGASCTSAPPASDVSEPRGDWAVETNPFKPLPQPPSWRPRAWQPSGGPTLIVDYSVTPSPTLRHWTRLSHQPRVSNPGVLESFISS